MAEQSKLGDPMSALLLCPDLRCFFSSRQQVVVMWLCLLASMQRAQYSRSKLNSASLARIPWSMGMRWQPTMMPLLRGMSSTCLDHGCAQISSRLQRLLGSTLRIFSSRSLKLLEMKLGRTYSPESIFLQSWEVLLSSKGRQPQTMAKRMTPQLQISTSRPWYFLLAIISGAAQQGDPQAVLSISSFLQVLLRPKSTILREFLQSMSRFQGLRSRWTMLRRCRQATPLMICLKYLQASSSSILVLLTMQSNNSPFSMYSMTRNRCRLVSMISYSWMMEGWRISLRMWISRDTRSTSATSIIFSFTRILMATRSPVRVCVPSFTFPKVPSPMVLPIRQYPIFFSFPASGSFIIYLLYASVAKNNIHSGIKNSTLLQYPTLPCER